MKRSLLLLPAALLAATLVSCSSDSGGGSGAGDAAAQCAPEGDVSAEITVDGEFGEEVTLSSETPVSVSALERSVLIEGDGGEITSDDMIVSTLHVFNASTGGHVLTEGAALQNGDQVAPWVNDAMQCSNIGDRAAIVVPATDIFGVGNVESTGLPDLTEDDSLVIVVDFKERLLTKAEGTAQELPEDAPTVELDADGAPTITIPSDVTPPDSLTVHTMIEGDGAEVQEGDRVYVHYRGVIWRTGEEFDSSWSRGAATDFVTTGVIGGFSEALVGHKVGSQMMSIVPAEDGGYGADSLVDMGHEGDDVMVFVLDILGTVPATV